MTFEPAALPQDPRVGADAELVYLGIRVPSRLGEAVMRHRDHVAALVSSIRTAGLDEAAIRGGVDRLVEQYRGELAAAIAGTTGESPDA